MTRVSIELCSAERLGLTLSRRAINKRINAGAREISQDLAGPAGQIALDRVVARHLVWFDVCQERGLSWRQIAAVLHAVGGGREGGLPFTPGHLSAVVWRQREKRSLGPSQATKLHTTEPRKPSRRAVTVDSTEIPARRLRKKSPAATYAGAVERIESESTSKQRAATSSFANLDPSNAERVRAAMKHAADLRRRHPGD